MSSEAASQRIYRAIVFSQVPCLHGKTPSLHSASNMQHKPYPQPGRAFCRTRFPIFQRQGSTDTALLGTNCGPVEAVTFPVAKVSNSQIPHPQGCGPFLRRSCATDYPLVLDLACSLIPKVTRFEDFEMPSGSRTGQRRSLSSTWSTRVAWHGSWSAGDSRRRKSGPMWVTLRAEPLMISCISTWGRMCAVILVCDHEREPDT